VTSLDERRDAGGNCFSGNRFSTSLPVDVARLVPCGAPVAPAYETDLALFVKLFTAAKPGGADYRRVVLPKPPNLPDMPDARHAPARPADTGVPMASRPRHDRRTDEVGTVRRSGQLRARVQSALCSARTRETPFEPR